MGKRKNANKKFGSECFTGADSEAPGNSDHICATCDCAGAASSLLLCKTCSCAYNPGCISMASEVFEVLLSILPAVGWVCHDCVNIIGDKRRPLSKEVESLGEAMRSLDLKYCALMKRVDDIASASPKVAEPLPVISQVVEKEVNDKLRRRKNIIVSGLPETAGVSWRPVRHL